MLLFILGYIACFALSVGPVTWVILSEIFPTRIRGRAMAIATVCLWIANYIVSQTFPMMDANPWLVGDVPSRLSLLALRRVLSSCCWSSSGRSSPRPRARPSKRSSVTGLGNDRSPRRPEPEQASA